jgi:hypothetical protein
MTRVYPLILLSALTLTAAAQQPHDHGAAPPGAEQPTSMPGMQERMQHMHDLMARIHATSDPGERQKLMDEHMRAMNEGMQMMRGGAMGQQPRAACAEGDTRCEMQRMQGEQQMMQRRMDMMQGMMGQMMEHMMQRRADAAPADEPDAAPGAAPENHEAHH